MLNLCKHTNNLPTATHTHTHSLTHPLTHSLTSGFRFTTSMIRVQHSVWWNLASRACLYKYRAPGRPSK